MTIFIAALVILWIVLPFYNPSDSDREEFIMNIHWFIGVLLLTMFLIAVIAALIHYHT